MPLDTEGPGGTTATGPYRSLNPDKDEIRVVILARGRFDEPIHCRLQHVSLSADEADSSVYESVSYCWGNVIRQASVQVDDIDVDVPSSAEEALRFFRYEDRDRTLWIDSICINQHDHAERNQQVAFMSKVYSSGVRNLIWLGLDDKDGVGSGEALLKSLGQIKERTATIDTSTHQSLPFGARYRDPSAPLPWSVLEPIARLLFNPYFGRMWVVQEAVLARSNLCQLGHCQLSYDDILNAGEYLWENNTTLEPTLHLQLFPSLKRVTNVRFFKDLRHGLFRPTNVVGTPQLTLNVLMTAAREFHVTEPKDVVYGVLGLYGSLCRASTSPASLPSTLTPNYAAPLSKVFANAARQAILDTGWLNTFRLVSHRAADPNPLEWPSWTPRYDRPETLADPAQLVNVAYHQASIDTLAQLLDSPTTSSSPSSEEYDGTITLKGILVASFPGDCVSWLSRVLVHPQECRDFLEDVRQILDADTSKTLREVFDSAPGRTLIAAVDYYNKPATDDDIAAAHAFAACILDGANALGLITECVNGRQSAEDDAQRQQAVRYAGPFWKACRLRRFFRMSSGAIGLGPETMQIGDELSVLYGGETPFVLHPRGAHHGLVGECYVDGLMRGEAIQKHRESGAEDTVFVLK